MVWFRIDDGFDDHPKVLAAGNQAIGLWTRCGAYSSRYLLDGFIPAAVARAKGSRTEITRLVNVGLWHPEEGGYRMHDFLDRNPSAEQVLAERARNADRQARHRDRHPPRNGVTPTVTPTISNGAPSRPVPTPSSRTQESSSSENTPPDDDDRFARTVELVVDAKVTDRHPSKPKAYRLTTRTNTIAEDGELIRRMLNDGDPPETIALFVLGHGNDAPKVPWCDTTCSTCGGVAWIDTGHGLAPCPDRKAPA